MELMTRSQKKCLRAVVRSNQKEKFYHSILSHVGYCRCVKRPANRRNTFSGYSVIYADMLFS